MRPSAAIWFLFDFCQCPDTFGPLRKTKTGLFEAEKLAAIKEKNFAIISKGKVVRADRKESLFRCIQIFTTFRWIWSSERDIAREIMVKAMEYAVAVSNPHILWNADHLMMEMDVDKVNEWIGDRHKVNKSKYWISYW